MSTATLGLDVGPLTSGRINPFEGQHGLPDPLGMVRGSREWHLKHDAPPTPPTPDFPAPPPPPGLPQFTQDAQKARDKARQNRGGSLVFTSAQGVPGGVGGVTTGKTMLGQ